MSLVLERSASPSLPLRPRSRSGLPLLAVLLVVLGLLGSVVVMAPRTVSLATTSPRLLGKTAVTVPEYGRGGATIVGYEHAATVQLTLPLRNSGLLPFSITSISLGGGPAPLLAVRSVETLPLTLWPGRSGDVTVTAVLTNCKYFTERELQRFDEVLVGFRALARAGTTVARFDRPVLVKSPPIVGCPDRKLDSEINNRRELL